jgi:predicted HAD superfamily phosphohydrolase YqeG
MTVPCARFTAAAEIPQWISETGTRTIIVDVEPLIAFWDTGPSALQVGVAGFLDQVTAATTVRHILFATNSARNLPALPVVPGTGVGYLTSARKPVRTAPYRDLPRPGMVIGDQVATDGALAWRLGCFFLHYCPDLPGIPLGPRLMRALGRPMQQFLFRTAGL